MGYMGRSAFKRVLMSGGTRTLADSLLATEAEGLALDFTDMSARVKGGSSPFRGDPNNLLTYSSPSTKWILNRSGIYESGTTLRTEYDTSGNPLGVRIEEARTNISLYSQQLDDVYYQKSFQGSGVTPVVTANYGVAPDGTLTADRIQFSRSATATTDRSRLDRTYTTSSGVAHTFSIWLKSTSGSTQSVHAYLNYSTGALAEWTVTSSWQRFSITLATTTTSAVVWLGLGVAVSTVMDSDVLAWGWQLEVGATPSSYIQTTTSTVTRAADNISLATILLPFNGAAGTLLIVAHVPSLATTRTLVTYSDGTNNERIYQSVNSSNAPTLGVVDGGVDQAVIAHSAVSANARFKVASVYAANDFASTLNGSGSTADAVGTLPTLTTLSIGSRNNAAHLNGVVEALVYIPRRLTNAEAEAMATL